MSNTQFLTVKQTVQAGLYPSEAGLRWLIFNEEQNGLKESGAFVRIGGRVMIDQERFIAAIRGENQAAGGEDAA